MYNKDLKKYELLFLVVINILLIVISYGYIKSDRIYLGVNRSFIIETIIFNILIIFSLFVVIRKFWVLRKKRIYLIFLVLNALYIINIFINIYRMIFYPQIVNVPIIESIVILLFFIGNLILILTYNRNLRAIKKKEKPV